MQYETCKQVTIQLINLEFIYSFLLTSLLKNNIGTRAFEPPAQLPTFNT